MSIIDANPLMLLPSGIVFPFISCRRQVAELSMPSLPVVEYLNVFCDLLNHFSLGKIVAMVGQFLLEDSQKLSNGALSK
jgi:hypothetical protein